MNTKNKEDLLVFGLTMVGLIATTAIVALIKSVKSAAPAKARPLNKDYVDVEQRRVNGVLMYHVYYDDGEFEYETSDHTLEAAMKSMRELVSM